MKRHLGKLVFLAVVTLIVSGCTSSAVPSGTYDTFAQCLTDKGAKMYGAYWCPHCQDQKEQFGDSFGKVTYIECATPGNPNVMTKECKDAGIEGYPTWVFSDGSRVSGQQTFETLSQKSGCPLPGTTDQANTNQ